MASTRKPASANNPPSAAAPDEPALAALQRALAALPALSSRSDIDPDSAHHTDAAPCIAVAFSGGLDSCALLDAVARVAPTLGLRVAACHVHHGLSQHADAWQAFCAERAAALNVPFATRRVEVPARGGMGIEAAARSARYAALRDMCAALGASHLLLAHHADDQAETVLLQLLRGTGLPGAAGMAASSTPWPQGPVLLRPWLDVPRAALQAYADTRALTWIDDDSNNDTHYLRNALRHDVLPVIARHADAYCLTLARFARHARQAQQLLDVLARQDLDAVLSDGALDQAALCRLDDARLANALRHWLSTQGLRAMSEARLNDWMRQLRSARGNTRLTLAHEGGTLRLYRGRLTWDGARTDVRQATAVRLHWNGERRWALPGWHGSLTFTRCGNEAEAARDPDQAGATIAESCLRGGELAALPRQGGERLRCHPRQPHKTLKHLFQEAAVPPWRRDVPVIWLAGRVLFVPHLGVNRDWACVLGEPRWRLAWQADPVPERGGPRHESMR